jgi:hypothetical protein
MAARLGENLDWVKKKKLLTSYLQRVISIHHPTVCPGSHNQKSSRKTGKEAGDILKKIPHYGEQPVEKGHMGRCQSWAFSIAGILLAFHFMHLGMRKYRALLFLTPHCRHLTLRKA